MTDKERDVGETGDLRLYPASEGQGAVRYTVVARDPAHVAELLAVHGVPDDDDPEYGLEVDEPYGDDAIFKITCVDQSFDEVRAEMQPEGATIETYRDPARECPVVVATAKAWCEFSGPGMLTCSEF